MREGILCNHQRLVCLASSLCLRYPVSGRGARVGLTAYRLDGSGTFLGAGIPQPSPENVTTHVAACVAV